MEVFDKDGNPVENVFSQEELDAKIAEAVKTAKPADPTPVTPPTPPAPTEQKSDDVMNVLKSLQETVNSLVKTTETNGASKFTASLDAEKKKTFETQFEALQKTGLYENTPEGIEKRAAAAYTLTTGETFDAGNFNMGNLGAVGGGKAPIKSTTEMTEADKQISAALGNTEDDIKKFGGNATT